MIKSPGLKERLSSYSIRVAFPHYQIQRSFLFILNPITLLIIFLESITIIAFFHLMIVSCSVLFPLFEWRGSLRGEQKFCTSEFAKSNGIETKVKGHMTNFSIDCRWAQRVCLVKEYCQTPKERVSFRQFDF